MLIITKYSLIKNNIEEKIGNPLEYHDYAANVNLILNLFH